MTRREWIRARWFALYIFIPFCVADIFWFLRR